MAASHDLEIKAVDELNAYVMALNGEKIWTVLCLEFGDNEDKSAIIVRALFGLKSTESSFQAHFV